MALTAKDSISRHNNFAVTISLQINHTKSIFMLKITKLIIFSTLREGAKKSIVWGGQEDTNDGLVLLTVLAEQSRVKLFKKTQMFLGEISVS